ncbi:MAG TPA: fused response regulator/phosphatase [Streptosporangiaceae bacterium]|nr:fused response regulator/phosphatase [Streptosporangiaceae bacterium]
MTSNAELETPAAETGHDQVPVLLVEDDDGDALLVEELLRDVDAPVVVQRARSLGQARTLVSDAACVLLDLGLPDSQGLQGLRQLLSIDPEAAIVVLTGDASEHLGEQAVRAGAQDYLVKGEVAGPVLHRVIRYAVERRRATEAQRELRIAQVQARENARLERGLLPSPLLADPRLKVSARCLAGGQQHLLGGDFYDVVEASDGWVHALIGDVCGRGPTEAALGVCLRVAWRTLVLAGRPADEILATLNELLEHEREDDTMFATLCMVSVAPERNVGWVRMAGHLPPLLVTRASVLELQTPTSPPLGLGQDRDWPGTQVRLDGSWSVLLYTDGLIEGRIGKGSERLGSEGLIDLITNALRSAPAAGNGDPGGGAADARLLDEVIEHVRELNGGDLDDDLAILALGYSAPVGP